MNEKETKRLKKGEGEGEMGKGRGYR